MLMTSLHVHCRRTLRLVATTQIVLKELRASPEEVRQRRAPRVGVEAILLVDPDPRQLLPPPRQLVALPRVRLLRFQQLEPRREPLFTGSNRAGRVAS
jgi:hypothetical protein